MWLIYSFEHQGWWKAGERGYTQDFAEAGHYSHDRAVEIVTGANAHCEPGKPNEAIMPVFGEK